MVLKLTHIALLYPIDEITGTPGHSGIFFYHFLIRPFKFSLLIYFIMPA